jgi:hypothetical protein
MKNNPFAHLVLVFLLCSSVAFGQTPQSDSVSLTGEISLDDPFGTIGTLMLSLEGNQLSGSASYPLDDYNHIPWQDTFEGRVDDRGLVEGTALSLLRQEISEAAVDGPGRTFAYVEIRIMWPIHRTLPRGPTQCHRSIPRNWSGILSTKLQIPAA